MKKQRLVRANRWPTSLRMSEETRKQLDWLRHDVLCHATRAYTVAWAVNAMHDLHQKQRKERAA